MNCLMFGREFGQVPVVNEHPVHPLEGFRQYDIHKSLTNIHPGAPTEKSGAMRM